MKSIGLLLVCVTLAGCIEESEPTFDIDCNPGYFDITTPEVTVPPGEDKMFCFYTTYQGEDTGIWLMEPHQMEGGHHILVMTTTEQFKDGTLKECSDGAALMKMRPLIFPNTSLGRKRALPLAQGTPIVIQFHYFNGSTAPFQARDVARFYTIDPAEVEQWLTPMVLTQFSLNIQSGYHTLDFDCNVPKDYKLVLAGGHMHEAGTSFRLSYRETPADPAQTIYSVDPWIGGDYRDDPPKISPSWRLAAGSTLSVHCDWNNSGKTLGFPKEMCAAFGYVQEPDAVASGFPTEHTKAWMCLGNGKIQ